MRPSGRDPTVGGTRFGGAGGAAGAAGLRGARGARGLAGAFGLAAAGVVLAVSVVGSTGFFARGGIGISPEPRGTGG
jgi:hypothetical protein